MTPRPVKNIYLHPDFIKRYKRLPDYQKKLVKNKQIIFKKNPFDSRLNTHKLHGKMSDYYSFSVTHSLRIVFEFIDEETVGFVDIGAHSIYK